VGTAPAERDLIMPHRQTHHTETNRQDEQAGRQLRQAINSMVGNDGGRQPRSMHGHGHEVHGARVRAPPQLTNTSSRSTLVIIGELDLDPRAPEPARFEGGVFVTYNLLLRPEVNQICDHLTRYGELPKAVGMYQRPPPCSDCCPSFRVKFRERCGVKETDTKVGLYEVRGQMLQPVPQTLQWRNGHTTLTEIVEFYRNHRQHDFKQFVVLSCKEGPSLLVEGTHDPPGSCEYACAELPLGSHDDLMAMTYACQNCMCDLLPSKIRMHQVRFRINANVRPKFRDTVSLVPEIRGGEWGWSGDHLEVPIPLATVRLHIEVQPIPQVA